jgi:pimeloyl-ACP methyl ester carboxylesterase
VASSLVLTDDYQVPTARGTLFARTWRPRFMLNGAKTVLLFHDSLGSVELWRDVPEKLAAATGWPVVAYDRLGFGRSDPRTGRMPRDFMREEARESVPALSAALSLQRLVPLGHSVGGAMATAVAARFPERCDALVTIAAQAFVEEQTLAGLRAARDAFAAAGQIARLERYHGDKAAWVLSAWLDTWLDPSFADWTLDEDLAAVRCRTLAIHGADDEYGSVAHPLRIVAGISGEGESSILPNRGHVPHREAPDEVIATVCRFLDSDGSLS